MKIIIRVFATVILLNITNFTFSQTFPIVDTDVSEFYDNDTIISAPSSTDEFYGQDASYN